MKKNNQSAHDTASGVTAALRNPEPPLRYRLTDRWADLLAGRRDGRADAAVLGDAQYEDAEAPLCGGAWLSRNTHTFAERDHREFLAAQAAAAALVGQLRILTAAASQARVQTETARAGRAGMPAEPSADDVASRGPGEVHDTAEAVAARRRAAHRRVLAQTDAAITAAEQQAHALAEQAELVRTDLDTLFQITRVRSERLRQYHQRRATTYRRAHRRAVNRRHRQATRLPAVDQATIPAAAWITQPNPWTGLAPSLDTVQLASA